MLKTIIKKELEECNKYIDLRIKRGQKYDELERVRKELLAILDK